ncbi:MAG: nucleotidyltransferase family protein [Clostridia bacterium]|nr:nucleotidyltransferase family protein [Clostridia bacterium]
MAVFLICEFDPFHFGHEYIIKKAKELYPDEPLVCVMSGNFVQRGRAACADKFARAECAVNGGADLVLSFPFPWCMSSAEHFASGALSVIAGLYKTGDRLVFGSECADIKRLTKTANEISVPEFKEKLSEYIKSTNLPYAEARSLLCSDGEILKSKNDILGVEYIKAAKILCPSLVITPIKREDGFLSSTEIKNADEPLLKLPEYAKNVLSQTDFPADIKYAERVILAHLRTQPYKRAADGEHGLISRISKAAEEATGFDTLTEASSSAQFTNARIRRVILYSFFGVNVAALKEKPCFTQLLAADKTGLSYLSGKRKTKKIEIITKPADKAKLSDKAKKQYALECEADKLYCLCTKNIKNGTYFLKSSPYIII